MRWFVYPGHRPDRARAHPGPSGAPGLELVPPHLSFLGPMIEQLQTTADPSEAEYFLVPALIDVRGAPEAADGLRRYLESLPHFGRCPGRHVGFLQGDGPAVPEALRGSVAFLPSCPRGSTARPMPYLAEPPDRPVPPIDRAEFEVSFQGTVETGGGVRRRVVAALRACRGRAVSCEVTPAYFWRNPDPSTRAGLREGFLRGIARSRFVFCPRGDGLNSLRFFEVLAHGRLPILVADEAALPLERAIPYDEFVVRVPEGRVESWEADLDAFLAAHPDLERASTLARAAWLRWFTGRTLGRFAEESLRPGR